MAHQHPQRKIKIRGKEKECDERLVPILPGLNDLLFSANFQDWGSVASCEGEGFNGYVCFEKNGLSFWWEAGRIAFKVMAPLCKEMVWTEVVWQPPDIFRVFLRFHSCAISEIEEGLLSLIIQD